MYKNWKNTVKSVFPFLIPIARRIKSPAKEVKVKKKVKKNERYFRNSGIFEPTKSTYTFGSIEISGDSNYNEKSRMVFNSFLSALSGRRNLPDKVLKYGGMSGRSYRNFINQVVGSIGAIRYLEIGVGAGSTAISALHGNQATALCIDKWSDHSERRDSFEEAVSEFSIDDRVNTLVSDFKAIDYSGIGKFDIYLYDGPHGRHSHCDAIVLTQPALKNEYILLIDDWNWSRVRYGTLRGLALTNSIVKFAIEIRTNKGGNPPAKLREKSEWHNGYFIALINKG